MSTITTQDDLTVPEAIAHLGQHPAWPALRAVVENKMHHEFQRLATLMIQGKTPSDTDIAFKRGFFAGMGYLIEKCSFEARKFSEEIDKELNEQ